MAGIYIHIPFCKQACHYCNFHFSTSLRLKNDLVRAILHEIERRSHYLEREEIETVYLGGGTPSLLTREELEAIFQAIDKHFTLTADPEITLEANPDDLDKAKLQDLAGSGINRLSIGIQSFAPDDLEWMNRAHNSRQAHDSLEWARETGFDNLSADLIYGLPTLTLAQWDQNLQHLLACEVPHISAYSLTVEEKTALNHQVKTGKGHRPDEARTVEQFQHLMAVLRADGFEHYEISNFARPGYHARHNSSYWTGKKYIGFGPAAHSFNGESRQWNIANNALYIRKLESGGSFFEQEQLSLHDRYNEYIMTSLRTIWGCDQKTIARKFGDKLFRYLQQASRKHIEQGRLQVEGEKLLLTSQGKLVADAVSADLFI